MVAKHCSLSFSLLRDDSVFIKIFCLGRPGDSLTKYDNVFSGEFEISNKKTCQKDVKWKKKSHANLQRRYGGSARDFTARCTCSTTQVQAHMNHLRIRHTEFHVHLPASCIEYIDLQRKSQTCGHISDGSCVSNFAQKSTARRASGSI